MYNVRVKRFLDSVQVQFFQKPVDEHREPDFSWVTGEIYERKRSDGLVEIWNPFTEEWERVRDISDEKKQKKLLYDSVHRTINVIYDIARSNYWEWFLTFTFSPEFTNRYDFDECSSKMSQWLRNMKKRGCPDMVYLIVPEQHKDGAWHFHGLFSNCDGMRFEDSGKSDSKGNRIYNIGRYSWGFTTATKVGSTHKASSYLCKYVTKELISVTPGKKRYWASRNCARPSVENILLCDCRFYDFLEQVGGDALTMKKVSSPFNEVTYVELSGLGSMRQTHTGFSH